MYHQDTCINYFSYTHPSLIMERDGEGDRLSPFVLWGILQIDAEIFGQQFGSYLSASTHWEYGSVTFINVMDPSLLHCENNTVVAIPPCKVEKIQYEFHENYFGKCGTLNGFMHSFCV